jgi:hypothetical protein
MVITRYIRVLLAEFPHLTGKPPGIPTKSTIRTVNVSDTATTPLPIGYDLPRGLTIILGFERYANGAPGGAL